MLRAVVCAISLLLLHQEPPDATAAKAKLDEDLAIAAEAVGEQLIKLKAWDEARAFSQIFQSHDEACARISEKLLAKTEKRGSGCRWEERTSALVITFGRSQSQAFIKVASKWDAQDADFSRWTRAEASILEHILEIAKAFARLTQVRANQSLPEVAFDWRLSVPAMWHALYLKQNPQDAREVEGRPGYSKEGAIAAKRSIASQTESLADLVTSLSHSPFDRCFLYQPRLRRIGFGLSDRPTSVVDIQSGLLAKQPNSELVLPIPKNGATDVPTTGYDDVTQVIPKKSMRELGYPVSLVFFNSPRSIKDVKVALRENLKDVEVHMSSPENPALPETYPNNNGMILLVPRAPLKPLTQYTVVIDYTSDGSGARQQWSFKTGR